MKEKVRIRRNVPMPEKDAYKQGGSCRRSKYPFNRMKIGNSFVVTSKSRRASHLAAVLISLQKKVNPDKKFEKRQLDCSNTKAGIWRVA